MVSLTEVYEMIKAKENLVEKLLDQVVKMANTRNEDQLVSITNKIDKIDPIVFFENAKEIGKDRIFWSSTAEDFYIVGIGNATEIQAEKDRFEETEELLNDTLKKATVHNPYQVMGTGIIALGGLSFDPRKKRTDLWKQFKASQFTIPEFTLTKIKNEYYYTITKMVKEDDDPSVLLDEWTIIEKTLLKKATTLPVGARITMKKEIMPEQWMKSVNEAKEEINNGQANKIVLARELRLKFNKPAEISVMLQKLLKMQANSYVFAFEKGSDCFVGATPERLIKLGDKQLLSTCLAGTAPRGETAEEDKEIAEQLLHDEKNREEHDYVVQMIRRSIESYCTDINIPKDPIIYPLKNLQHLYTPVRATLKNEQSIFDIIQELHPTPALGGVPREKSLAFIRDHELLDRGWYGAPIGWLDSNQNAEFAVAIRSGLVQGEEASLFAGCGIMKDSDPEAEYEETNIKFLPMLSVLEEDHESY